MQSYRLKGESQVDHQKVDLNKVRNIHLMGVGGAGMSGLALLFHELGFNVSGCDMGRNTYAEKIERAGVKVLYGHDVCHLDDCKVDGVQQRDPG